MVIARFRTTATKLHKNVHYMEFLYIFAARIVGAFTRTVIYVEI